MKYIDEVCSVLSDEVERRYLRTRDAWQMLSDEVSAADEATPEQIQTAEQAHKDYIRASKKYLATAFKRRLLAVQSLMPSRWHRLKLQAFSFIRLSFHANKI